MLFLAFVLPARLFWSQFIRSAEYAADSYAVAYLHEKNIDPRVMIGALSRTSPDITEPTLATYLLFFDHPTLAQRSENIERTCRRLSTGK
jgi:Zn-dependent protease with chaperone function